MKTLFKTLRDERAAGQKREALEKRTGVKWDCYWTGDGMRFTPVITRATSPDPLPAEALAPHVDAQGRGFAWLAESTGIGLSSVLAGAKSLIDQGRALPVTNRMGNIAGIRTATKPYR